MSLPNSLVSSSVHLVCQHVCVVSLSKVLEVRKGQLTERFDQFPYEEVEDQSFSLIFEQVRSHDWECPVMC